MTDKQRQHLEAAEAGLQILDDNHDIWTGQTAWETKHTALVDLIEHIYTKDGIGVTDNKGAARTKKTIRLDNGKQANIICGPLKEFLLALPDETQEATIHFSFTQLTYATEKSLLARWKQIIDVASLPANAAFFTGGYGITTGMVSLLDAGRIEFVAAAPTPKAKRAIKGAAKTDLKADFVDLALLLTGYVNLAQGKLGTDTSFVESFENALGIDNSGNRHENAVFTLRNQATNVLLDKVKLTFTKGTTTFLQKSTKKGLVTVKGKAQGNWTLLVECETYVSQTLINIPFDPEKPILKQTIKLVKA